MKPISEAAQLLIDSARAFEAPPPGARRALRPALDARIAAGTVVVLGTGAAAHGAALSLTAKVVIGTVVLVGAVTVGTAVHHHTNTSPPVVQTAPQPAPSVAPVEEEPEQRRSGPRVIVTPPRAMSSTAHSTVEPEPTCGLAQEVKLLQQAELDLHERPEQVLVRLDQASTACPGAGLEQERLALRILALCHLHRLDEARAATKRLELEAPQSPSLDRIRAECE